MKTSYPRHLSALALLLCLLIPTIVWGQDTPRPDAGQATPVVETGCKDALLTLADQSSLGLRTLLGKMNPEQVRNVLQWSDCDTPGKGLETVYEHAVREHDGQGLLGQAAAKLYISPSQTLEVSDPEGAFARRELVDRVRQIPEARGYATRVLGGTLGALTWRATLADLNAQTHSLEAQIALNEKGLSSKAGRDKDLAASLLVATSYVNHAKEKHPMVFTRLSASAASVDALGLLIRRAEETLLSARALAPETHTIMASVHGQEDTLRVLFKGAGVKMPVLHAKLTQAPTTPVVVIKTPEAPKVETPPQPGDDESIKLAAVPAKKEEPVKEPAKVEEPVKTDLENPEPKKTDTPPAKKPESEKPESEKPAGEKPVVEKPETEKAEGDGDKEPAKVEEPEDELGFQIRLGVLITLLLVPWLWLGILVLLKRRKNKEKYLSLANRTLAVATLLLVIVSLVLTIFGVAGAMSSLASWDSLAFAFPLYWLLISLLMLRKLDTEDQLASLHLMRRWGKWGGLFLAVVIIANAIVVLMVPLVAQYVMSPSFAVVGIVAIVFLIKLWRTGNIDPDAPPVELAAKDEQAPDPAPEAPPEPAPKPQTAPKPTPEPVTIEPSPVTAQEASTVPDDFGAFEDTAASAAQDELSDEDFAAQLDAMETGEDAGPEEVPEDRAELYRLLGGSDKE